MKQECNIIQDLLPNYIENLVSKDTAEYIENHINGCDECKKILELMQNNTTDSNNKKEKEEEIEVDHLKKYKKKMKVIKRVVIILVAIIVIALLVGLKFAMNYNTYNIIAKNVVNSRQELENSNNYSIYKIWGYENKETGEMIVKSIQEYYYKDGKYKIVDKLISNDNLNIEEALNGSDGVIIDKIEYGSTNSDDKVRIFPRNKKIENITISYEESHYIKHLVYSYALVEIISADDKDWKANFAMNFSDNNIQEDNFLGIECYIIKENESHYQERWYDKENYRPIRIISNESNEFKETIFFYNENSVTDEDVEFNQEQYKDYIIKNN